MRIYELAKELGVDNRVVIARATELGLKNKTSHSHSLDPHEADLIRRAIIRQAIGTAPEREVVTTRVDKLTGEKEAVVEKRKGNVIRRRKASGGEDSAPDALSEPSSVAPETPEINAEIVSASLRGVIESDPIDESKPQSTQETVSQAQSEDPEDSADEAGRAAAVEPAGEETKKGAGPRVLGKIELPTPKLARGDIRRNGGGPPSGAARPAPVAVVAEDTDGRGDRKKSKSKRREFGRADFMDYDQLESRRVKARPGGKSKDSANRKHSSQAPEAAPAKVKRLVQLDESILVGELAKQLSVKVSEVVAKLMELGVLATINQVLDRETAQIVAEEFGAEVEIVTFDEKEFTESEGQDDPEAQTVRPPVVTVMGHVDHGKTSLLDAIRRTSVAAREHGGITQHIGAYTVTLADNRKVTFIDTPGHEAFTAMRARGAELTDIVVLVVSADDGVMPQTIEAVNHAKAAKVPVVVAVNKMDRPGANPDRVKQQLAEIGVQAEDWGGDTMFVKVSALKGDGIKELLESILLQAEVRELRANPDRRAKGTIIEARQDRGRGTVATVLVQNGTLRVGDIFVSGAEFGRVRSMLDATGAKADEATPSIAVEITGFSGMPSAGDDFLVVDTESQARQINQSRREKLSANERILASGPISFEEFARRANSAESYELNVILKADVHGSIGAIKDSLEKVSTPKVKVRVVHAAVGGVTESDIQLAVASKAIVIGFGVRADPRTTAQAENAGVEMRFYRIIYELLDDIKTAMAGLLPKIKQEVQLGRAEVRETFMIPKIGMIAGCYVTDGLIKRSAFARLVRDSRVIFEGKIGSLRRFKDDAKEVQAGFECGIGIEAFNDLKLGDVIDVYEIKESAATL